MCSQDVFTVANISRLLTVKCNIDLLRDEGDNRETQIVPAKKIVIIATRHF